MTGVSTAFAVVVVAGGVLLTGCAAGNPYALPGYQPSAGSAGLAQPDAGQPARRPGQVATAPTAGQAASTGPVAYHPADVWGEGAWVERGRMPVTSRQQRAVVDAVVRYLSVRVQLSNTWQVDEPALAAVASGEALTSAQQRAESQRAANRRSVGRFIVNVSFVRIAGSTAAVTGCNFDATSEVDQNGGIVVSPPGGVLITMDLKRTGDTWRVVDWPQHAVPYCDWRVK